MSVLLNKEQWTKIAKGATIAVLGAVATYIAQASTGMDFGQMTPLVVAGLSVLVNYLRKTVENLKPTEPTE